ncbi:hypothetical protein CHELA40_11080 [Chelatococcus asaccharovorans]|nr:hypothetical protein CHELA40_11080 [Chelatococcus asaccharovorans]CAH1685461.1 hypothetical protein CHELA17_64518 [Chelatococcus asaccharovorans]
MHLTVCTGCTRGYGIADRVACGAKAIPPCRPGNVREPAGRLAIALVWAFPCCHGWAIPIWPISPSYVAYHRRGATPASQRGSPLQARIVGPSGPIPALTSRWRAPWPRRGI